MKGGMPVSAHKLAGLVRKAPVTMRSAEFCIESSSFIWEGRTRP